MCSSADSGGYDEIVGLSRRDEGGRALALVGWTMVTVGSGRMTRETELGKRHPSTISA